VTQGASIGLRHATIEPQQRHCCAAGSIVATVSWDKYRLTLKDEQRRTWSIQWARESWPQTSKLKRTYDTPATSDGTRILVDHLWPRGGVSKTNAGIDVWDKDIAPSTMLRNWFGRDPARWREFRRDTQMRVTDTRNSSMNCALAPSQADYARLCGS
jgi:uncharacterized protein YeaO (DUF488 family)